MKVCCHLVLEHVYCNCEERRTGLWTEGLPPVAYVAQMCVLILLENAFRMMRMLASATEMSRASNVLTTTMAEGLSLG
eukprot:10013118-Karenia_brevis.AAC.1